MNPRVNFSRSIQHPEKKKKNWEMEKGKDFCFAMQTTKGKKIVDACTEVRAGSPGLL